MGLTGAVFDPRDGRLIDGVEMEKLSRALAALEEPLAALERRGVSLRAHADRQDPETARLPVFHVFLGRQDHWFTSRAKLNEFVEEQEASAGGELEVAEEHDETNGSK